MYDCEICGFPVDEIEDIEWVPTPSILDPDAMTRMCRDCARERDLEHYFVDPVYTDNVMESLEEIDPLYLEELFDRE